MDKKNGNNGLAGERPIKKLKVDDTFQNGDQAPSEHAFKVAIEPARRPEMEDNGQNQGQASTKVCAVVELLENILLHAEFIDVLRCQRVNITFARTIATSRPLQRKLHMLADEGCDYQFLPKLPKFIIIASQKTKYSIREHTGKVLLPRRQGTEESWEKMLLVQPPVTTFWNPRFTSCNTSDNNGWWKRHMPLTLGTLVGLIESRTAAHYGQCKHMPAEEGKKINIGFDVAVETRTEDEFPQDCMYAGAEILLRHVSKEDVWLLTDN